MSDMKLKIWNSRMLELIEYAIFHKYAIDAEDLCIKIGFNYTNLAKVKVGKLSFQMQHMIAVCKLVNCSMDYICGLALEMQPRNKNLTAIQMIEQSLGLLKAKQKVKK